jgi:hypothetical protein
MNTRRTVVLFTTFSLLAFAQAAGGRGKGRNAPRYDPSTEATFTGTIEEVKEVDHAGFLGKGLHAMLKTDQGMFDVHIGPASFAATEQLTLAKGDQLEVVGSKVKDDGVNAIIARNVKKGGKTTTLRNQKGIPLWSGGRRRSQ